jgi:hypothetical protein
MSSVGGLEDAGTLELDMLGVSEVDSGRRREADARVVVVMVGPPAEASAERAAILDRAETIRELWPVCESLELGL